MGNEFPWKHILTTSYGKFSNGKASYGDLPMGRLRMGMFPLGRLFLSSTRFELSIFRFLE